jgi:hypothetical protein
MGLLLAGQNIAKGITTQEVATTTMMATMMDIITTEGITNIASTIIATKVTMVSMARDTMMDTKARDIINNFVLASNGLVRG